MRVLTFFERTATTLLIASAFLATGDPQALGGETIRDRLLGISITLPDGFVPVPVESQP